jgi:membrane protease YdiL (CAAX protease family)
MLFGAGLSLVGPMVIVMARRFGLLTASPMAQRLLSIFGMWALVAAVFAIVLKGESQPLSSMGLATPTWSSVKWGLVTGLIGVSLFPLHLGIAKLFHLPRTPDTDMVILAGFPWWLRLLMIVTAAFAEEVLYRGYPITRLSEFTGSIGFGAVIALVFFVLAHIRWGLTHLIYVSLVGGVITIAFIFSGDLWATIIGHGLCDLPLLAAPLMLRRRPAQKV